LSGNTAVFEGSNVLTNKPFPQPAPLEDIMKHSTGFLFVGIAFVLVAVGHPYLGVLIVTGLYIGERIQ
jgi:hypothetical protein